MATISIIILLALFFCLFYFSERMTLREIMARPSIGLTTITIGGILFLVTDYNGRYYGLNPIIFNPVRLPQDVSIMIDRDNNLYITGKDELEILGPVSEQSEHMPSLNRFKIIQSRINLVYSLYDGPRYRNLSVG